jgi:hypothetical protein
MRLAIALPDDSGTVNSGLQSMIKKANNMFICLRKYTYISTIFSPANGGKFNTEYQDQDKNRQKFHSMLKKDKQIFVTILKIIIFLIGIKFVIFHVMGKRLHSMKRNVKVKA